MNSCPYLPEAQEDAFFLSDSAWTNCRLQHECPQHECPLHECEHDIGGMRSDLQIASAADIVTTVNLLEEEAGISLVCS